MDDLAPAPAQRTSDDSLRTPERNFAARKKAVKKVAVQPAQPPEPEAAPEAESDHEIDVLA